MYAVIETGGKQYKVQEGETVYVEKLPGEKGDSVSFDRILLVSGDEAVAVGRPVVEGAKVEGEILHQGRGDKLIVYKFKRRKNYRRKNGHRQSFTAVKINSVVAPS